MRLSIPEPQPKQREFFTAHRLELAPTAREDSFRQRFYLYLMMTKPSKKLILSYANVGGDGRSRRPSYLIGEICKMFPKLEGKVWEGGSLEEIYSAEEARQQLVAGLRRYRDRPAGAMEPGMAAQAAEGPEEEFLELFRWFLQSEKHREEAIRLAEAAFCCYENQGIGHAVARALYGNILSGSVTRLEQYAACAYAHFLQYGLELTERRRYELAAVSRRIRWIVSSVV